MKDLKGLILQCQLFICTPPKAFNRSHCLMHFRISHFCQAAYMHNAIANLLSYPTAFPHFPTPTLVPLPLRAHAQEPLQRQNTCGSRQPLSSLCTVSTRRPRAWKIGWAGVIRQTKECCPLPWSTPVTSLVCWIPGTWYHLLKLFLESHGIRHL